MTFDPPLPSPFYRVTTRAIILVDNKLVAVEDKKHLWYLPGGGWEQYETLEDSIGREVKEELGVKAQSISNILFTYRLDDRKGFSVLRLAVRVIPSSHDLIPGDDMIAFGLFSKEDFIKFKLSPGEGPVQEFVDLIWSEG